MELTYPTEPNYLSGSFWSWQNGADLSELKKLEERIAASTKECADLKRLLEISNKQKQEEIKKYKIQAREANKESERVREKYTGIEEQLKEKELEAQTLHLTNKYQFIDPMCMPVACVAS